LTDDSTGDQNVACVTAVRPHLDSRRQETPG